MSGNAKLPTLVTNLKNSKTAKERKTANSELHAALFGVDCCTLTGRVRGCTTFTKARNTPFSGLAADGAKLALWNLTHAGFFPSVISLC